MEIAQSHIASFTCTLILSTPVTETETPTFVFSLQSLARSQRMSRTMQALYSIDPRIAKDVFETEGKLNRNYTFCPRRSVYVEDYNIALIV